MTSWRPLFLWCAALFAGLSLPLSASASVVDRIAATVDDRPIALSEVYELGGEFITARCSNDPGCIREMEHQVLDALIKRALVRTELRRLQLDVGGEELDQAIERIVVESGLEDRRALRSQLESEGTRWETFRTEIADRMRTQRFQQRVIGPRVVVHDDEVRDLYNRSVRSGRALEAELSALGILLPEGGDAELHASMITEAERLVVALNAGDVSWETAVDLYDAAGLSEVVGGRTYRKGQLTAALDEVAFGGEVGQVQAPVRVGNVMFILRIDSREMGASAVQDFDEMENELKNQIFMDKLEHVEEEWYQRARRQTVVDILLDEP